MLQIVLVTLIGALAGIESVLDEWQWHRPLLTAMLIGLAMGDLKTGLIVGGLLELIALGWMNIGAAQSPDTALASVVATVLAVRSGHDVSGAIALAIPVAVAGNLTTVLVRTLTVYFQHQADRIKPSSGLHYLGRIHLTALSLQALRVAIPSFLFVTFVNRSMMIALFHALPAVLTNGFTAASGFIVVVGYGMVIRSLQAPILMPYFILGFLVADFSSISLVGVGVLAACLALLHERVWTHSDTAGEVAAADIGENGELVKAVPNSIVRRVFWRSQLLQASWNYERMLNLGYAYALEPVLDWLYLDEDAKALRKQHHLEFFNTQPYVANLVLGVNMALEEGVARGDERTTRLVTSMKLGMMGPLAGVGDSIFWGTLRPLLASIGATLALRGSIMGPILFFFSFNAIRLGVRWSLLKYGYRLGLRIVQVIATGVIRRVTEGSTIIGLIVMGALVADWAHIQFAPVWHIGGGQIISLNKIFDSLLPKLPALLLVWGVIWLINRGWTSVRIILLLFVLAILGVWSGLLAP